MYQLPQKPYFINIQFHFQPFTQSARMHFSFRYFYSVIQQTNGFIILATGNQFINLHSSYFSQIKILTNRIIRLLFFILF